MLVTTGTWTANSGRLRRYTRRSGATPWVAVGPPLSVRLGEAGLGWGRGLHAPAAAKASAPAKREGDRRSPAGVFALGTAFGRAAHKPYAGAWPWRAVDARDRFVDDPRSPHYNSWQRAPVAGTPPWRSAEQLAAYTVGLVVRHNTAPAVAGAGSAIFIHDGDPGAPSVGCTTLPEAELLRLLAWLDPRAAPVLVQLPVRP